MDEIAAVTALRAAIPAEDAVARDAARHALAAAMHTPTARATAAAAPRPRRSRSRNRRGYRCLLCARLDAPPGRPRRRQAGAAGREAGVRDPQRRVRPQGIPIFRRGVASEAIVSRAHGVLGIESSVGPIYIWAAPTRGGGLCWTVDVVRFRLPGGRPNGGGMCGPYPERHPAWITGGMTKIARPSRHLSHPRRRQGSRRGRQGRAALRRRSADELPVFEGFVLAEPRAGATPVTLVALDARRATELRRQVLRDPLTASPHRMPEPIGPERTLFSFDTAAGFPLTFSLAPAEHGNICTTMLYRGGTSRGCGPDQRARVGPGRDADHAGTDQNEGGAGQRPDHAPRRRRDGTSRASSSTSRTARRSRCRSWSSSSSPRFRRRTTGTGASR